MIKKTDLDVKKGELFNSGAICPEGKHHMIRLAPINTRLNSLAPLISLKPEQSCVT